MTCKITGSREQIEASTNITEQIAEIIEGSANLRYEHRDHPTNKALILVCDTLDTTHTNL